MKTFAIVMGLLLAGGDGEKDKQKPVLRLKPAVAVRGLDVTVGELCELTPADGTTLALAQVKFGPAPVGGYARTVTRGELVQALAAAKVDVTTIKIEGADEATVQAITVEVSGQELLDAATTALQAQLAVEGGDVELEAPRVRNVQAPPGRSSQELRARVRGSRISPTSAVVDVDVLVDGESCKKVPVTFKLQRYYRVLKTTATVRAGTPLGPDNLALVREPMDQASGLWLDRIEQVAGLIAARNLQPSQRVTLGDVAPPALVHRGDIVTVVMTKGRVKVTTKAIANHDAPLDGRITLTNLQSRSALTGVVHGPGLVVVQ